MKICVVGATGSISSYLLPRLVEAGHDVAVFNRGNKSLPSGVRQMRGDRRARATFEQMMQAEKFDTAIDFISYSQADAESSLRAFAGIPHVIHISSCTSYAAANGDMPVDEAHPLRTTFRSEYERGKTEGEAVINAGIASGFPATIVKLGATFGGYSGPRRQVTSQLAWLDRIRQGKPIVIDGNGETTIQCLHSEDAVTAIARLVAHATCIGETYNLVQPQPVRWAEHHRAVMDVLGRQVPMVAVSAEEIRQIPNSECYFCGFAESTVFSATKLQRALPDWSPKVSLYDMLRRTISTLEQQNVIPDCTAPEFSWEDKLVAATDEGGES